MKKLFWTNTHTHSHTRAHQLCHITLRLWKIHSHVPQVQYLARRGDQLTEVTKWPEFGSIFVVLRMDFSHRTSQERCQGNLIAKPAVYWVDKENIQLKRVSEHNGIISVMKCGLKNSHPLEISYKHLMAGWQTQPLLALAQTDWGLLWTQMGRGTCRISALSTFCSRTKCWIYLHRSPGFQK